MKILFSIGILLTAVTCFGQKNIQSQLPGNATGAGLNAATDDWQIQAQHFIKESEYHFKQPATAGSLYAANMAQRLGFSITAAGYKTSHVTFSQKDKGAWQQNLAVLGFSKGG